MFSVMLNCPGNIDTSGSDFLSCNLKNNLDSKFKYYLKREVIIFPHFVRVENNLYPAFYSYIHIFNVASEIF